MYTFLSIIYVLVCLFLILVVLLQPGRGGVGGAFGGGTSQTVFGGSGAGNFLTRLTSISAALFMILSATLAYMSSSSDKSLEAATQAAKAKAAQKAAKNSDAGVAAPTNTPVDVQMQEVEQEPSTEPAPADQPAPTLEQIVPPTPSQDPAPQQK
jgi:preprotein translocase subunit SecG